MMDEGLKNMGVKFDDVKIHVDLNKDNAIAYKFVGHLQLHSPFTTPCLALLVAAHELLTPPAAGLTTIKKLGEPRGGQ